ncbi:expressed unknown protein [Seminavis robusta]|uniref:Uncharacterized protein n=1 Tax=Seminavis robusta TaxID=568900 RepID=A0A9N8HAL1_9STRA|nr:expressed unknown protein [Seminavis robusta]|eukprot:Sro300_g111730.1 n/a (157) ;mRNA; r:31688-32158
MATSEEEYLIRAAGSSPSTRRRNMPGRQRNYSGGVLRQTSARELFRSVSNKSTELNDFFHSSLQQCSLFLTDSVRQTSSDESVASTTSSSSREIDDSMRRLSVSKEEINGIIDDDEAFRNLKRRLKQRGCVTSSMVHLSLHSCVKDIQESDDESAN